MKNLCRLIWLLVIVAIFGSCYNNKTEYGCIRDYRITIPNEPNCPSISFLLISSHVQKIKAATAADRKIIIEVKGSYFDNPDFHHGDWRLPLLRGDSIILSSRSCYFAEKNKEQLDSIILYSLDSLSITISDDKERWFFKNCKDSN